MIFHGEKCRHCSGKMSQRKPVLDGPRKGLTRSFCTKCGHIEFHQPAEVRLDEQVDAQMDEQQSC